MSVSTVATKDPPVVVAANTDVSQRRVKSIDDKGRQTVKGGQNLDEPFLDGVTKAYSNLVNSPVDGVLFLILCLAALAEVNNAHGPFELLADTLSITVNDGGLPSLVRNLASILLFFVKLIITYKVRVIGIGLMWSVYMAKPSNTNMKMSIMLSVVVLVRAQDLWSDLLLANLYFLWTQLRPPFHRFILMCIGLFVCIIGFGGVKTMVSTDSLRVSETAKIVSKPGHSVPLDSSRRASAPAYSSTTPRSRTSVDPVEKSIADSIPDPPTGA